MVPRERLRTVYDNSIVFSIFFFVYSSFRVKNPVHGTIPSSPRLPPPPPSPPAAAPDDAVDDVTSTVSIRDIFDYPRVIEKPKKKKKNKQNKRKKKSPRGTRKKSTSVIDGQRPDPKHTGARVE